MLNETKASNELNQPNVQFEQELTNEAESAFISPFLMPKSKASNELHEPNVHFEQELTNEAESAFISPFLMPKSKASNELHEPNVHFEQELTNEAESAFISPFLMPKSKAFNICDHKLNPFSNMENVLLRFPHLAEQICQELGNQDLIKCKELSRSWKEFVEDQKFYWIRMIIWITTCFIPKRDILEHLLKNSNGEVVKKIGVAACETIRKHAEGWYRNVFYFALVSGQTEFLKKLLISSKFQNFGKWIQYNVNASNLETILLYHAAERGDLEIFQFITENSIEAKNPRILVQGHFENTPLHIAAENGHFTIVELIIPRLIQKNPRNKSSGRTPLELAALNGHFDISKLIMTNVKVKNPQNRHKETPLHYATKNGHFDICKLITEKVKDKSPKDVSGDTPLHYAAANEHFSICELLKSER